MTARPAKGVHVLGDVLRRRREERHLTRAELSDLSGVTARTIQRAESGGPVTPQVVRAACGALGLDFVDVLRPSFGELLKRLRACGHAPPVPPQDWIPREAETEAICAFLGCGSPLTASHACAIAGAPGIGKSALAMVVVTRIERDFPDGIAWLDGSHLTTTPQIANAQRELGAVLGFGALLPGPHASTRDLDQAFRHFFWSRRRLLVIDDVRSVDCLDAFARSGQPSTVLYTTHSRRIADCAGRSIVDLGPLSPAQTRAALEQHVATSRLAHDELGTPSLLALIGSTPGSIHATGRLLAREPFTRPSDLVRRVEDPNLDQQLQRPQSQGLVGWERGLFQAYAHLKGQLSHHAWELWMALSVFGPHPFPASYAATLCDLSSHDALHALSELLDLYLLLRPHVPGGTAGDADAMVRLHPHAAAAGRVALGDERDHVLDRLVARVRADSWRDGDPAWLAHIPEFATRSGAALS